MATGVGGWPSRGEAQWGEHAARTTNTLEQPGPRRDHTDTPPTCTRGRDTCRMTSVGVQATTTSTLYVFLLKHHRSEYLAGACPTEHNMNTGFPKDVLRNNSTNKGERAMIGYSLAAHAGT